MKLDNQKMNHQSFMGAILTIIGSLLIGLFFYAKLLTILNKHEVDIFSALKENALTQDDIFTAKDGFFVAAALTRFNNDREIEEDWRYGELVISTFGWGYTDKIEGNRRKLDYHYCSDEELGLARTNDT